MRLKYIAAWVIVSAAATALAAPELLFENSNFEQGTLDNWKARGDAFTQQPTKGDNVQERKGQDARQQGEYWIGTFERYDGKTGRPGNARGDAPTGRLESVPFRIEHKFVSFRVGGGSDIEKVGVALLRDGEEVKLFSGSNSETMRRISVDVSKYMGDTARLLVYDQSRGSWGHINVDDFRGCDEESGRTIVAGERPELEDKWSTFPLYKQVGYDQALRPQFHFTSRMNWLNDPNGLVYYDGEWHMYFQHVAIANNRGPKSWGSAVSTDLVHWKQLPHAINPYPNVFGKDGIHAIWSGSAVVDVLDALGKQKGNVKTIYAIYTATNPGGFFQAAAYSTDSGRSLTKINGGRPVIPHQEGFSRGQRDPNIFYYEPGKCYITIMMIGGPERKVRLWKSTDLLNWEAFLDIPNKAAECIDMYSVNLDGDPKNKKWVISNAGTGYEVGEFDGKTWKGYGTKDEDGRPLKFDYGDSYYAAQTFNQAPDNRVVQIGWMPSKNRGYRPFLEADMPFTQQMSFPAEITLRTTEEGIRMFRNPVKEIAKLYRRTDSFRDMRVTELNSELADLDPELIDLTLEFVPQGDLTLKVRGLEVEYLQEQNKFRFTNRERVEGIKEHWNREHPFRDDGVRTIPAPPVEGKVKLRALVDRASLELFVNDGAAAASFVVVPDAENRDISVESDDDCKIESMVVHELRSIW